MAKIAMPVGEGFEDSEFGEPFERFFRVPEQTVPGVQPRPLTQAMVDQYWTPVQECTRRSGLNL